MRTDARLKDEREDMSSTKAKDTATLGAGGSVLGADGAGMAAHGFVIILFFCGGLPKE